MVGSCPCTHYFHSFLAETPEFVHHNLAPFKLPRAFCKTLSTEPGGFYPPVGTALTMMLQSPVWWDRCYSCYSSSLAGICDLSKSAFHVGARTSFALKTSSNERMWRRANCSHWQQFVEEPIGHPLRCVQGISVKDRWLSVFLTALKLMSEMSI